VTHRCAPCPGSELEEALLAVGDARAVLRVAVAGALVERCLHVPISDAFEGQAGGIGDLWTWCRGRCPLEPYVFADVLLFNISIYR